MRMDHFVIGYVSLGLAMMLQLATPSKFHQTPRVDGADPTFVPQSHRHWCERSCLVLAAVSEAKLWRYRSPAATRPCCFVRSFVRSFTLLYTAAGQFPSVYVYHKSRDLLQLSIRCDRRLCNVFTPSSCISLWKSFLRRYDMRKRRILCHSPPHKTGTVYVEVGVQSGTSGRQLLFAPAMSPSLCNQWLLHSVFVRFWCDVHLRASVPA